MRTYARFESLFAEANAASGSPDASETVSTIPGGYQDCGPDSNGNTVCDAFTGFRTDASGLITDFAVNGHPVAPRLAAGGSGTGSQLTISDVVAYRLLSIGEVVVTYKEVPGVLLQGGRVILGCLPVLRPFLL